MIGNDIAQIDLLVVPAVAFDASGARCGHGRGYYDCFLSRLRAAQAAAGGDSAASTRVRTVGLALACQMVENVPLEEHDERLDLVLAPE